MMQRINIESNGPTWRKAGSHLHNERTVNIYSSMGDIVRKGEVITLTGELVGYEDKDISLQWQYDDGTCWMDVPGANDLTHSFSATAETINYSWRLAVTVKN